MCWLVLLVHIFDTLHAFSRVTGYMMSCVAPEVGLAGQALRDGRRARETQLGGEAAGLHGGTADAHTRLPHHLQAAPGPVQALSAGTRPRWFR